MIDSREFLDLLSKHNLTFYAGVPDSLLKDLCAVLTERNLGITCANEGNAVGLAAGYHLATGRIGVCYMQNSGLGNAFNPLMSLTHQDVYSIPVLLLVGWRGEPGIEDEPQHVAQGKATLSTLKALSIEHSVLPKDMTDVVPVISQALDYMTDHNAPYALVIRKGTFLPGAEKISKNTDNLLTREAALSELLPLLPADALIISTTGKLSRELFELREAAGVGHQLDFLTVGSMGHASSIALGVARHQPDRLVFCLDGDGAALMHLGAMATTGTKAPDNFRHVIFNNGAHDSVGGQPTAGFDINLTAVASACGYRVVQQAQTVQEIRQTLAELLPEPGPSLLEIRIGIGSREDLGRPTCSPKENKTDFMNGMS